MTRKKSAARDLSVGAVVALAAVIFGIAIFSIGSEQRLWSRKVSYRIRLADTGGLQVGSPVRLVGMQVGTVTDIRLSEDPNNPDIDVTFSVDHAVESRIRSDTMASLKVLSLLGGDKFLQLTPGTTGAPILPPGSYIAVPEAMGFEEFQAIGGAIVDDLVSITSSLKVVLQQLQNPQTIVGQALSDPNFGRETLGNIKEATGSTKEILAEIETGKGLVGRLVTDERFAEETISRIEGSLASIESLLARLADEKGAVARALAPDGSLDASLKNVQASTETLLAMLRDMKAGRGLAGRALNDDAFADEILGNLKQVTQNLKEITGKINRGEGTAGAFINDPQIYEDLQNVVRGVQSSKFVSRMIRHYREKGEKARAEEGAPAEAPPRSAPAGPSGPGGGSANESGGNGSIEGS